ncbi:MAG: DUF192 domain-containing protein [bacterium]|nr:DUF192 domain-containing protein [bacterium]
MMNFSIKIAISFLLLLFPLVCFPENSNQNKVCTIEIVNTRNKRVKLSAEIADTVPTQRKGLMFRMNMKQDHGMIFVFANNIKRNFWMKNTYIPLSIAYISSSGVINEIYDMKPLDISVTYPSKKRALFALEVNKGWFGKNNITRGCKLIFHGCFSK